MGNSRGLWFEVFFMYTAVILAQKTSRSRLNFDPPPQRLVALASRGKTTQSQKALPKFSAPLDVGFGHFCGGNAVSKKIQSLNPE